MPTDAVGATPGTPGESEVWLPAGAVVLAATLGQPTRTGRAARGVVVFAHGSGSSRHSPRNRFVAGELQRAGYATVLLDLLTEAEETVDRVTRQHRFDVELLGERLAAAIDWTRDRTGEQGSLASEQATLASLPIGLFGASTGAAAALRAAAARPGEVRAVVSRGGRPDLAGDALDLVRVPTLLVVGGADDVVLALNRSAAADLGEAAEVVVVPGATHLFAEPGALEQVVDHARRWFDSHLGPGPASSPP